MREVVLIHSSPRSGSNFLCDLISQYGYVNYGEYYNVKENRVKLSEIGIKENSDFLDNDKIVIKFPLALSKEKKELISLYDYSKSICLTRRNLIRQAISLEFATKTGIFMYRKEINEDFTENSFPTKSLATSEKIIQDQNKKRDLFFNDRRKKIFSLNAITKILYYFSSQRILFNEHFDHLLFSEDLFSNYNSVLKDIFGYEKNVEIRTIKQSDEITEEIYELCLQELTDEEIEIVEGGWVKERKLPKDFSKKVAKIKIKVCDFMKNS